METYEHETFGATINRKKKWKKITDISVVPDAYKIFHNSYWVNEKGENPEPFVVITLKDLEDGKFKPIDNAWKKEDVISFIKGRMHPFLTLYP